MAEIKGSVSLRAFCEAHLERKGRNFICPACGSGTKKNGTPAFSIQSNDRQWKCFSCDKSGDVFDLAGILNGTDDKAEQRRIVAEWAGIDDGRGGSGELVLGQMIKDDGKRIGNGTQAPARGAEEASKEAPKAENTAAYEEKREQHRAYIKEAQGRLRAALEGSAEDAAEAVSYLQARGIGLDVAVGWGLGYDPNPAHGWKDAAGSWQRGGRIVIPWAGSDYYHIDRACSDDVAEGKYSKPRNEDVGPQPIWNRQALSCPSYFVVEGAIDALAVQTLGYEAVALGGVGGKALLSAIAETPNVGTPILMLDNDEPGAKASKELEDQLVSIGIKPILFDWSRFGSKDAGEAYAKDAVALCHELGYCDSEASRAKDQAEEDAYLEALSRAGISLRDPADVVQDVYLLNGMIDPVPTGMAYVDHALGGGLYGAGLIVIGAVSSVGKTTFALQIMDNIARSGRPVLFVSIEQSAAELVSKSLSRIMYGYVRGNGTRVMASASHIMSAKERGSWDDEKASALLLAGEAYSTEIAPFMRIIEPRERPTVADVRKVAEHMAKRYGQPPVVCVDYLQLLAPVDPRASDKQNVDENVHGLRMMAKDLRTPVVAISSMNRSSYNGVVSIDSFKESGSIEYGADQLIGLQPASMEDETDDKSEAKAKQIGRKVMTEYKRADDGEVSLSVLKNRNGRIPMPVVMTYRKLVNLFED